MQGKYLEKLGLDKNTTTQGLNAKWKAIAKEFHPDVGGDMDKFIELSEIYKKAKKEAEINEICPNCDGKGEDFVLLGFQVMKTVCCKCKGTGKIINLVEE
jgi:DnaJ-class molecular chaperone